MSICALPAIQLASRMLPTPTISAKIRSVVLGFAELRLNATWSIHWVRSMEKHSHVSQEHAIQEQRDAPAGQQTRLYTVYTYDYDAGVRSAVEVAQAIGSAAGAGLQDAGCGGRPATSQAHAGGDSRTGDVGSEAFAAAVGLKKIKMAEHKQAEKLTKLQTGGISPLALINSGFDIYMDARARTLQTIAVSAGERGRKHRTARRRTGEADPSSLACVV